MLTGKEPSLYVIQAKSYLHVRISDCSDIALLLLILPHSKHKKQRIRRTIFNEYRAFQQPRADA